MTAAIEQKHLRAEIRRAREELEDVGVYDAPDCVWCDREMEIGEIGGGQVKFGCYHDDCDIKEEKSEYTYYHSTRSTAPARAARARLDALLDLAHRVALVERGDLDGE